MDSVNDVDSAACIVPGRADAQHLLHLGVILWWLLDRSRRQRATEALVGLLKRVLPFGVLMLKLPKVRGFVTTADSLFEEGLLGNSQN